MKEEEAIKKETIDNFLELNLNKYIESIIEQLEENQHLLSERESVDLQELLIEIRGILNNNAINLVITELNDQNYNFDELISDLDISTDYKVEHSELVRRVIRLLVSQELLKVQLLLSSILDNESNYDVFLSHCSWDAREILGLKLILEYEYRASTYVDWVDDKHANFPRAIKKIIDIITDIGNRISGFDFDKIEKIFSRRLRKVGVKGKENEKHISDLIIKKLKSSKSIFYVQSRHYDHSRWMPWELGIAEASGKKIYRLPIKYVRNRKKYGKRSGFLTRYKSIINENEKFKKKEFEEIIK